MNFLMAKVGSCLLKAEDQSRLVAMTADLSGCVSQGCLFFNFIIVGGRRKSIGVREENWGFWAILGKKLAV